MNRKTIHKRDWLESPWGDLLRRWDEIENDVVRATYPVQSDPKARIQHLRPHYTNEHFKTARTVYLARGYKLAGADGETVKGASYNYSDRVRQWHKHEDLERARNAANEATSERDSALWIEVYLQTLTGDAGLKVVHIMAGFNWSNGYDYQVYGFIPGVKTDESSGEVTS